MTSLSAPQSDSQSPENWARRYPSVSICFPAYNEQAVVRNVVVEAYELFKNSGLEYEILACDDGSTDQTGEILDELSHKIPSLRVFHNPQNMGMNYTFEYLYGNATKDFVFLNATDRQWPTPCIFRLLPLAQSYDIIVASRKNKHYGIYRNLLSYVFNSIPRWIFGIETYDAGAVKLIKREIVERFTLISRSPFSEAERMIRAARAGYRITELQIDTAPRETGVARGAKLRLLMDASLDVVRVWWDLRRNRHAPR